MISRRKFLAKSAAMPAVLASALRLSAAEYDLVIKSGRVIDPSQRIDRIADVAIRQGRIAAIRPNIASSAAAEMIDATGKLVTPGLIDVHVHIAEPGNPPAACLARGVTSVVDCGSRGGDNIEELVKVVESATNRARILVNIAHLGNNAGGMGELLDIQNANIATCRRAIEQHRKWIIGIKARLSRPVAGDHDLEALRRAREVADPLKVPIMVHIGDTASPLPEILALLRPGDIVTHLYATPHGMLDEKGQVLPEVREARRRGVLFDFGNGRTLHWTWDVVERAIAQGFLPDTISTDLNVAGQTDQVFDLPNIMSKFLLMGVPLNEVIARVTVNSARTYPEYKSYGTLKTGATADVTILELREGDFEFVDNYGGKRMGKRRLFPYAVVNGGKRSS